MPNRIEQPPECPPTDNAHFETPKKCNALQQAVTNCFSPIAGTPASVPVRLQGLAIDDTTPKSSGKRKREDATPDENTSSKKAAPSPWTLTMEHRIRKPLTEPGQEKTHAPVDKHVSAHVYKTKTDDLVAISPASRLHLLHAQQIVKSKPQTTVDALAEHWNWLVENRQIHAAIIQPDDVGELIESFGTHVSYYEQNIRDQLGKKKPITPLNREIASDALKIENIQRELKCNPAVALGQPILNTGNMVYSKLNKQALAHLMNIPVDSPELPNSKTLITFSGDNDSRLDVAANTRQTHVNISWTRRLPLGTEKTGKNKDNSLSMRLECAAIGFVEPSVERDTHWLAQEMQALTDLLKNAEDTRPIWIGSKLADYLRSREQLETITPGLQGDKLAWPFRAGYTLKMPADKPSQKALSEVFPVQIAEDKEMSPGFKVSRNRYDQGTSLSIYHDQCSEQRLLVPLYGLMAQNHLLESQAEGHISQVPEDARLTIFSGRCSCMSCMGAISGFAMGNFENGSTTEARGFGIRFLSTTKPSEHLGIKLSEERQSNHEQSKSNAIHRT